MGRAEAIRTLEEGHRATAELVVELSNEELAHPATIGGGDWSAKDLIAHLADWERYALEALAEWREGKRSWVEDVFTAEETDRVNDEAMERSRGISPDEARTRFERAYGDLVAAMDSLSDEEWNEKAPYETERRTRLGNLLGSITAAPKRPFGHAFAHLGDLRAYVDSLRTNA